MVSRTRVLIIVVAVACGWMLGYGMGGGFRSGGKSPADSRDDAAAHGRGAAAQQAGSHNGTTRTADDTLSDQIAARRIPWTRERLMNSFHAITHDADVLRMARMGLKLADQLGPQDFPAVLELAKGMKDDHVDEAEIFVMLALVRWAELNPKAAADYVMAKDGVSKGFISGDSMVLLSWGASDPGAAVAWAEALPDKEKRKDALKEILQGAVRRDADAAIALARAHAPELLTDGSLASAIDDALGKNDPGHNARVLASLGATSALQSAVGQWSEKDPAAAMQWAEDLPDEKQRAEALKGIWGQLVREHPEDAAAQLSKNAAEAPYIEGSTGNIITKLTEKDPQQAARWAAALQQPGARKDAFAALGDYFGAQDPAAGGQWLNTFPAGAERDGAIKIFADRAMSGHPQDAAEWATAIEDTEARRSALGATVGYWCKNDIAAALEWLQTSPSISEEDRQAILKKK